MRSYRRSVAVVSQNVLLFSGTLKDNITYGLSDVTAEQLDAVIAAANLGDVVASLPRA